MGTPAQRPLGLDLLGEQVAALGQNFEGFHGVEVEAKSDGVVGGIGDAWPQHGSSVGLHLAAARAGAAIHECGCGPAANLRSP